MPVLRGCACAALTCRLLTEVFVCTQASELRGRLRSPRYPPSRAPVSGTSRTSLCFTASCPQTLPARTLSQPPLPSPPTQHSGIAHEPLWTLPPPVDIWLGRLGAPPRTECQEEGGPEGYQDHPPVCPRRGAPNECMCCRCYRPCLSSRLSVCVSVTVREGCLRAGVG